MSNKAIARSKKDNDLVEAFEAFQLHIEGKTQAEIAEQKGISRPTVKSRIDRARKYYFDELTQIGKQYYAEIWSRYEYVYRQAQDGWETTRDPLFLKEIRAVLEAFRKMAGLDAPPRAAVNENGQVAIDKLVLVMSEDAYLKKEQEAKMLNSNIIEGEFVTSDDPTG